MAPALKLLGVGALLGAICACAPGRPVVTASAKVPVTQTRLDNGLELIVHEDHATPQVAVDLWYHAGSKDDPAGRPGLAHLVEHAMFLGSRHVPRSDFELDLERA